MFSKCVCADQWEIMVIGPNDTLYEGGFLRAELIFPEEYPLQPPVMRLSLIHI